MISSLASRVANNAKRRTMMLSRVRSMAALSSRSYQRQHQQRLAPSSAVVSPLAAASTLAASEESRSRYGAVLALVGALTISVTCSRPETFCDDKADQAPEEEEEEDPYDNLPEEDEPTHCSICLTYRQGPCRPYWRKVEACTKDNELKKGSSEAEEEQNDESDDNDDKELGDPPCLKYMLPWIDCASQYRNLYALIELDTNYTMGVADLEKEATLHACWAPGKNNPNASTPTVNWTSWKDYLETHPDWKLPDLSTQLSDPNISLWKTLGTDRDPEVVEVVAMVPSIEGINGVGILECAYALDQHGNILGFAYGTKPSEIGKKSDTVESTNDTDNSDESGESEESVLVESPAVELKIRLLPSHTTSIVIAASYTQPPPKEETVETQDMESHILKSRPFSLDQTS